MENILLDKKKRNLKIVGEHIAFYWCEYMKCTRSLLISSLDQSGVQNLFSPQLVNKVHQLLYIGEFLVDSIDRCSGCSANFRC